MVDVTAEPAVPEDGRKQRLPRLRAMPLRWRLLAVTLGLIAVALAVTSLVVSALLRVYLLNQTEQELRVYAASLSSIDPAELSAAGPQLPTGFTTRIIDVRSGSVSSLGEAVTEQDQAQIPNLSASDPRVTGRVPFRIGSTGGDSEWLALAQLNEPRSQIYVLALPLSPLDRTVDRFLVYAAGIGAITLSSPPRWVGTSSAGPSGR